MLAAGPLARVHPQLASRLTAPLRLAAWTVGLLGWFGSGVASLLQALG